MTLPPIDDPGMHLLYALHKKTWPVLLDGPHVRVKAPDGVYEVTSARLAEMEAAKLIDLRGERPAVAPAGFTLLDRWCHRHYVRPAMRKGLLKRGKVKGRGVYRAKPAIRLAAARP